MKKEERGILEKVKGWPKGLLSQSNLMNSIAGGDTKSVHSLITSGYIEETKRKIKGVKIGTQNEATFYRITEKGKLVFEPLYKRLWYLIRGDVRVILISLITSVIVTAVTTLIFRK